MRAILFSATLFMLSFAVKSQNTAKAIEDGHSIVYYKTGKIKSIGNYVNNQREGEWLYFHENGNVALKKNYLKGEQTGEWAYFSETGHLAMKVDDISKIQDKTELVKIEDGIVVKRAVFVNGKRKTNYDNSTNSVIEDKF